MKRCFSLLLSAFLLAGLCACSAGQTPRETEPSSPYAATKEDIALLNGLYEGRQVYYGELHDHSDSGGTTDGKIPLRLWPNILERLDLDFAAIVDHRQSLHMRMEEWDNSIFLGATETGHRRWINDVKYALHFNILMSDVDKFEKILQDFEEFNYNEGYFKLKIFSEPRFAQMYAAVQEAGGMIVHVHPKGEGYLESEDPMDYYFGEKMGLEVLCSYYGNMSVHANMDAYALWVELLNLGKQVYATSGSDSHRMSNTVSATTVYSEKKDAGTYLSHIREGDFTAGPVGIRMAVGDTVTGGKTDFGGKRLVISVGDFQSKEYKAGNQYRLDVYNEKGLVFSEEFDSAEKAYFAIPAEDCEYYRADVYDVTACYIFAVGNPIWNEG